MEIVCLFVENDFVVCQEETFLSISGKCTQNFWSFPEEKVK